MRTKNAGRPRIADAYAALDDRYVRYNRRHKKKIAAKNRAAYARRGDAIRTAARERARTHHAAMSAAAREEKRQYDFMRRLRLRDEVIAAYGGKCKCCSESISEFLAVDHVYNDGAEHRREVRGNLYAWLKRHGFPKRRFQLLCHNCNAAKNLYGRCPHKGVK